MSDAYTSTDTLRLLLPEIILIAAATLIYVGGAFMAAKQGYGVVAGAALAVAAAVLLRQEPLGEFSGPLAADAMAYYVRLLMLPLGGLLLLATWQPRGQPPEYTGSLLLAIAGAMLTAASGELVLLFLGLELISIPTYVLLYLGRRDAASQESAAKYFYLSIISSAVMLYGFSFLYGVTGSTQLDVIYHVLDDPLELSAAQRLPAESWNLLSGLALVLIFGGMAFKMAAVPFQFYAPDVYQGATHGNAAVLAVVPKVAGVVVLARLAAGFAGGDVGWRVALIVAIATMTVGNVLALWQDNLRRLLAYSSIAHAGYLLIGLAVAFSTNSNPISQDGLAAALFYLAAYAVATIGAFAVLAYLGGRDQQVDSIGEIAGLARSHPCAALAMTICLFSLAGVPPLAGFLGKLTIFFSAPAVNEPELRTFFVLLAVAGAVNAAIAAAYYLRVVKVMYFHDQQSQPPTEGGAAAGTAALASVVLVVGIGLFPTMLVSGANRAAKESVRPPTMQLLGPRRTTDRAELHPSGRR